MINKTQKNLQEALNLIDDETEQIMQNMHILADNGYYTNKTVHEIYDEGQYHIIMPNKEQAGKQKDCLRRNSQRKQNHNKKDGFPKHNMIKEEKNYCYIYPENQILPVKQVYPGKYNDKIIYYTSECKNCLSRDICLTNKMTSKVITDYTSDAKELLAHKFKTPEGQAQYKKRMPIVEPRFAYNKYTLHYRQYHLLSIDNAKNTTSTYGQNTKHIKNTKYRTKRKKAIKILIDLT